jgi:hypothetical protein
MAETKTQIRFPQEGGAAELQVSTPLRAEAGARVWKALASIRVKPIGAYEVRSRRRLIAHAKLTEPDGAPIGQQRAGEVLSAVAHSLSSQRSIRVRRPVSRAGTGRRMPRRTLVDSTPFAAPGP